MTDKQLARFWKFVDTTGDGGRYTYNGEPCHIWKGYVMKRSGYGQFGLVHGKPVLAHVLAYELRTSEPVPQGKELDHLCRHRHCVLHTEAVTHRENVLRGTSFCAERAAQTHCIHGHELTGDNLILKPDGRRNCRACKNESQRRRYQMRAALRADALAGEEA